MNRHFLSFAAGLRAGVTGVLASVAAGPAIGCGAAVASLVATGSEVRDGALVKRPGFSTGAGLSGLFAAAAIGIFVITQAVEAQASPLRPSGTQAVMCHKGSTCQ